MPIRSATSRYGAAPPWWAARPPAARGHFIGKSLAIGYVDAGHGDVGSELEIEILGKRYPARAIPESPHDPDNERLRS